MFRESCGIIRFPVHFELFKYQISRIRIHHIYCSTLFSIVCLSRKHNLFVIFMLLYSGLDTLKDGHVDR